MERARKEAEDAKKFVEGTMSEKEWKDYLLRKEIKKHSRFEKNLLISLKMTGEM